jgi:EpsI family protein
MVALGTLVAHVCFQSWWRRAGFMAMAVVVPVLANGVRAWGTIYIAQSRGIAFAAGFDHIVYGWIFFALVMVLVFAIGWRFFDRRVDEPFILAERIAANGLLSRLERLAAGGWRMLAAIGAICLAVLAWAGAARALEADIARDIALPQVPGWVQTAPGHAHPWHPRAGGADNVLRGAYRDEAGDVVDVVYAIYAAQGDEREAGAYGEGALPPDTQWRWLSTYRAPDGIAGERLQALGTHRRAAETWFRAGDWTGASTLRLKLITMQDRLLLRARPTSMLIISAEERPGTDAAQAIARFRSSTAELGEWMDQAGGVD